MRPSQNISKSLKPPFLIFPHLSSSFLLTQVIDGHTFGRRRHKLGHQRFGPWPVLNGQDMSGWSHQLGWRCYAAMPLCRHAVHSILRGAKMALRHCGIDLIRFQNVSKLPPSCIHPVPSKACARPCLSTWDETQSDQTIKNHNSTNSNSTHFFSKGRICHQKKNRKCCAGFLLFLWHILRPLVPSFMAIVTFSSTECFKCSMHKSQMMLQCIASTSCWLIGISQH